MVDLSQRTRDHVGALFPSSEVPAAEALLARACADNLPALGMAATPASLERVRFAALRLSGGRLEALEDAVELAQRDWRDLLVAAGLAEDPGAHERWSPRRPDGGTAGGRTPDAG